MEYCNDRRYLFGFDYRDRSRCQHCRYVFVRTCVRCGDLGWWTTSRLYFYMVEDDE